jgi:hypothetical protein
METKKYLYVTLFVIGFLFFKSALSALLSSDETTEYELFFGWKTTKSIFIVVRTLIGLGIVTHSAKELATKHGYTKKDIIAFIILCIFIYGFLANYDRIKELLF